MTEHEKQILAFEKQWWHYRGAKEAAITEQFGISAVRYHQLLARLLDRPEALQAEPVLVNRLRRIRSARANLRRRVA